MSYAVFFGVLSATCLVGALAALWSSLRAAFGGEGGGTIASAADAPERAALLDEKTSLLRAIKDLHYEHQVGKLDVADFERLDRAYRARAKEVLELLDRDVRPYRARAEALLAGAAPGRTDARSGAIASKTGKGAKKKKGAARPVDAALSGTDEAAVPSGQGLVEQLDALSPEKRAAAEAFLAQLAADAHEAASEGEPSDGDEHAGAPQAESVDAPTGGSSSTPHANSQRDEEDEEDEADEESADPKGQPS